MAAAAAEAYKEGVQRAAPVGVCPGAGLISECEEDRDADCRDLAYGLIPEGARKAGGDGKIRIPNRLRARGPGPDPLVGARGCDWTDKYTRERNGHNAPADLPSWLLPSVGGGRNLTEPFFCHFQPPCLPIAAKKENNASRKTRIVVTTLNMRSTLPASMHQS